MAGTFTLYGKKWRLPKPDSKKGVAVTGDSNIRIPLGGKPWLLFSAKTVNLTRNNLKQQLELILTEETTVGDLNRQDIAPSKVQVSDVGTIWSFDPPKIIVANRLSANFEDTVSGDDLTFKYVLAAET